MKYLKLFENWYSDHYDRGSREYRKYSNHKSKFLKDFDYTYRWVREHNPQLKNVYGDYSDMDEKKVKEILKDHPEEYQEYLDEKETNITAHIKSYMELYEMWEKKGYVPCIRSINVDSMEDVKWNEIGVYWSFTDGGDMGRSRDFDDNNKEIYLTFHSNIEIDKINWENSLDNFTYYGSDENEVKVYPNVPLTINKIEIGIKKESNGKYYKYTWNNADRKILDLNMEVRA